MKAIIDYFIDKEEQNIRNAFVTPSIVEKFEKKRFAQQRTKQIEISRHDTPPEYVKLAFIKSNEFTPQQRSYLHLAYWAISLANLDERVPEDQDYGKYEIYMKKFVYIFVLDLGISPFIKCYQEKSLVQACVLARRNDFLRELLSHKYEMLTKNDFEDFVKSCKSKDRKGNNIFHEIFMLPQESRNRFLETIYSDEYQVKAYLNYNQPAGCCGRKKINIVDGENRQPDKVVQIGEFYKRNRLSLLPYEMEHQ